MPFLQCQTMRSVGTLASAHPPTDSAQRGPDTHSVILLENIGSPGNAARLFAETPFQCCAVHLQKGHDCGRQSPTWDCYGKPYKTNTSLHCLGILRSFLAADAATNVGTLCHRNRTFKDASGASPGHCVAPRGDAVMITESTRRASWGSQAS